MAEPRDSFLTKVAATVVAAVIIALLVGTSSPWWVRIIFPETTAAPNSGGTGPTPTPASRVGPTATAAKRTKQPSPTAEPATGCVLTIENPFVDLHESPAITSLTLSRVPKGDYETSDTALADFAGQKQRWFKLTADGRVGWVLDDTILIAGKSSGCP